MVIRAGKSPSMETRKIDTHRRTLNACVAALRYFGLWAPGPDTRGILKLFYVFYNKAMLALVCIFAGTIVADVCANYRDLTIVTDDGCFLAGIAVIVYKIFNFQFRRRRIEVLIGAIHRPVDALRLSSDEAVLNLLKMFVLYEKTLVYFFTILGGFLVVALMIFAPTEKGSLPIRARYPFDTDRAPLHEIAFFVQASAITTAVVAIVAMDATVIGFCRFTDLQLRVLNANFVNCRISSHRRARLETPRSDLGTSYFRQEADFIIGTFVPFEAEEADVTDDNFVTRFKTCVMHHQRLTKIVDDINELFSTSMLVQLCGSSSIICLAGFQAVLGAQESANFMKFTLYLGTALSQLLCWCWFGNKLIYQSNNLATSLWFSGWEEETDLSLVAVLMTVALIRTRRSAELKAGCFYAMSMETFVMILRSSYSFFALLTTVNEEEG